MRPATWSILRETHSGSCKSIQAKLSVLFFKSFHSSIKTSKPSFFEPPPFVLPSPDGSLYVPLVYSVQRPSTLSTIRKTGKRSSPSFLPSPLEQFVQNTEPRCFSQFLCSFSPLECWPPLEKRQSLVTKPALTMAMAMIMTIPLIS